MRRSGRSGKTVWTLFVAAVTSVASCRAASEVLFHGDYLSPSLKEAHPRQAVTEVDLSNYLNDLLGLASVDGDASADSFAAKATKTFLLDKPQSVAVLVFDDRTPKSSRDVDAFALPFQSSPNLTCQDAECLLHGILRAPHTQLPLTTLDFGGRSPVSFLTPHHNHQTLDNSISDAERSASLVSLNDKFPPSLKGIASLIKSPSDSTSADVSKLTIAFATDKRPEALSSDVHILEESNQCTTLLLAELKALDIGLQACLYAERKNVAPLVCAAHPNLAISCFETAGDPQSVTVAAYLMKEVADSITRQDIATRRPMVVSVTVPLAAETSLPKQDLALSVARRPPRCGWTDKHDWTHKKKPSSVFYKRMLGDAFEGEEGLAVRFDEGGDVRADDDNDSGDDDDDDQTPTMTSQEREQKAVFTHIILWTSLIIIFTLVYVIYLTMAMTNVKDPLLYTKMATS